MFWSDVADPAVSPLAGHPEGPEQGEGSAKAPAELPLTAGLCEQCAVRELRLGGTLGWQAAGSKQRQRLPRCGCRFQLPKQEPWRSGQEGQPPCGGNWVLPRLSSESATSLRSSAIPHPKRVGFPHPWAAAPPAQ